MPYLDLKMNQWTRRETSYLGALMLFPHDKEAQDEAIEISIADIKANFLRNKITSRKYEPFSDPDILELLASLQNNKPIKTLQEETEDPYKWGAVTGIILLKFVGESRVLPKKPLIGDMVRNLPKSLNISEKTFNNRIFPRYKPVSHLWASFLDNAFRGGKGFPCQTSGVDFFLALAEAYRIQGETLIPSHSRKPFLDSGKTWKVPKTIHLPQVPMEFGPLKQLG